MTACSICHPIFDRGLLWVQKVSSPAAVESAPTTAGAATVPWQSVQVEELEVQVHASQRSEHWTFLRGGRLRLPQAEPLRLRFPVAPVWEWRRVWADKKSDDELAKQMGTLGLSGPCERMDKCLSAKDSETRSALATCALSAVSQLRAHQRAK